MLPLGPTARQRRLNDTDPSRDFMNGTPSRSVWKIVLAIGIVAALVMLGVASIL